MQPARVHVRWAVPIDAGPADPWLDGPEQRRLAALTQPWQRRGFGTARLLLKELVAELTAGSRSSVRLTSQTCPRCGAAHGRPQVDRPAWPGLQVSISHPAGLVVVAATDVGPVGVDVEPPSAVDFPGFDQVSLSPAEQDLVSSMPAAERGQIRAGLWVRKEAFLKATGQGLGVDPHRVDTTALPPDPAPDQAPDQARAQVHEVAVQTGFTAAVAVLADRPVEVLVGAVNADALATQAMRAASAPAATR